MIYWKTWENSGIRQLKNILNPSNYFLTHNELVDSCNIKTIFIKTFQVQKGIPTEWLENIKISHLTSYKESNDNILFNNKLVKIQRNTS